MTDPKEEAKRIVEMFDECLNHIAIGSNGIEDHLYDRAKQCAIIHVDGMLKELKRIDLLISNSTYMQSEFKQEKQLWIAVRQEIEKM